MLELERISLKPRQPATIRKGQFPDLGKPKKGKKRETSSWKPLLPNETRAKNRKKKKKKGVPIAQEHERFVVRRRKERASIPLRSTTVPPSNFHERLPGYSPVNYVAASPPWLLGFEPPTFSRRRREGGKKGAARPGRSR